MKLSHEQKELFVAAEFLRRTTDPRHQIGAASLSTTHSPELLMVASVLGMQTWAPRLDDSPKVTRGGLQA